MKPDPSPKIKLNTWLLPILVVVLRFVQGLAVGGEWGGAVLMATEHSGHKRRGFFGSFAQVGSAVGGLMSTGMFLLMQQLPEEAFLSRCIRCTNNPEAGARPLPSHTRRPILVR